MERHKRWQTALIIFVTILTIYNIFPTLLYYSKPLDKPVGSKQAEKVGSAAMSRVNDLEAESISWIKSYCKLLKTKYHSVATDKQNPHLVKVTFKDNDGASAFKKFLPKAGALIPFYPAQLSLSDSKQTSDANIVYVQRKIPVSFSNDIQKELLIFTEKFDVSGKPTPFYTELIQDRLLELGRSIGGVSENAHLLNLALSYRGSPQSDEFLHMLTQNILTYSKVFDANAPALKRHYRSFSQGEFENPAETITEFMSALSGMKERVQLEKIALVEEQKALQKRGEYLDIADQQKLETLISKEERLIDAQTVISENKQVFASGLKPWSEAEIRNVLYEGFTLDAQGRNPLIQSVAIDWSTQTAQIQLHPDISSLRNSLENDSSKTLMRDELDGLIFNEVARIGRDSGETLTPNRENFQIALNSLEGSQSLLVMKLPELAKLQSKVVKNLLLNTWHPEHKDLKRENFPIYEKAEFDALPTSDQHLCLVVYAPGSDGKSPEKGFRNNSIYIIAKDVGQIVRKFEKDPQSPGAQAFFKGFNSLQAALREDGFTGYAGSQYPFPSEFASDYIFEAQDYYNTILQATREDFQVRGTKRYATLEFSTLEQRIRTRNTIETRIQEDLIKWRDEYNTAQVDPSMRAHFDVPKPTRNVLYHNTLLSIKKYFRGDDRKVLKWGLDLKGGKTVQLELRNNAGRVVTNEDDLNQGVNELYNRVNKMGVPDVSIRREGNSITLDFPSAQGLSAAELVKASSMSFHVVNEMFAPSNTLLAESVNRFLQDVWNEAVVTGKKDSNSINRIAWNHLYGEESENAQPRSDAAKTLYKHGLRLSNPDKDSITGNFNDSVSRIAILRGENFSDWQGQVHPLLVVFNNYALEGSSLDDVRASYDPTKGNFLSFSVKGSQVLNGNERINPRSQLHSWTSTFSKEKVMGTPLEKYSGGRGWRMAVVLNGFVVSSPTLDSALRDTAMISGHFTQREVNRLESDLKAGSLSFTPHILSEKNVSPELGTKERYQGIVATVLALVLVIATMIGYYRFAGVIASVAVLFNLLIIWATLQNIGASITLAGIAGIILTLGMAVDANVLVFERIREEFAASGRIAQAVNAGYKKAFSAIVDSNLTTIIAALILLNFDAGPVKGFALTLIIGIASSMFTALFMTRYFFSRWVQNPKNTTLTMANLIKPSNFNFLKWSKVAFIIAAVVVIAGAYCGFEKRHTILGMDFTGGNALAVELKADGRDTGYRGSVEEALIAGGASMRDVQVRELTPSNQLRLFFGPGMDQKGAPFYQMPLEASTPHAEFSYETNPRLVWLVDTLQKGGLEMTPRALAELDSNWTSVSGQMSESMRNNAVMGLLAALVCILIYITFRFEFKYAISATLGLGFDVVVTLASLAILNALGVNVQIDLNIVAALMTIVGYSLNDTIIVFDRVREDVSEMRKASFFEIINHALNVTLSRTVMTSVTTLLVLIALVLFGGSTIFGFALFMAIGVVVGTLSSFFVASALLLLFQNREVIAEKSSKA